MTAPLQAASPLTPKPLSAGNFRRVAQEGFGDGCNSYAYSSVWFNNHIYVGTVRNVVPVMMLRWPFKLPFVTPPVPQAAEIGDLDLRGQIWRFSPTDGGEWEQVFRSPLVEGLNGKMAPLAIGFRCMTVYQGRRDPTPAIYTFPVVGRNARSAVTLRSYNGTDFDRLPPPSVSSIDSQFGSFRAVVPFKGKLFVAPSHARANDKTQVNVAPVVRVLCTDDPAGDDWHFSSPESFNDPTNAVVFDMAVCGDYLYASVGNIRYGFQLWRTDGEGAAPHHWELVFDRGADRGQLNQAAISFAAFGEALYMGTGIQNGGFDRTNNVGPAAAEVLRVWPDKSWDLVIGEPRQSRQGLKIPLGGMNAGFDNPLGTYMWRMCVHEGALYVGTHDLSTFARFADPETWPPHLKRLYTPQLFEQFLRQRGGCDLWRTTDGEHWVPVTQNGFDCPYNYGIRVLQSTPHGLFVGTANPFGPEVAVRSADGWRHVKNSRGGLEMHWGRSNHTLIDSPQLDACATAAMGGTPLAQMVAEVIGGGQPAMLDPSLLSLDRVHDEPVRDPLASLADVDKDLSGIGAAVEDEIDAYFAGGPRNAGYWRFDTKTPADASTLLLEELGALIPDPETASRSLVVGDEKHAEAWRCLSSAHGIESDAVSERSPVRRSISGRPRFGCKPASHDIVVWIEGPFGPDLKENLSAASRVLRPGGVLLIADLLLAPRPDLDHTGLVGMTSETYCQTLAACDFAEIKVCDITADGWEVLHQHSRDFFAAKLQLDQLDQATHNRVLDALPGGRCPVASHLLVSAVKRSPGSTDDG